MMKRNIRVINDRAGQGGKQARKLKSERATAKKDAARSKTNFIRDDLVYVPGIDLPRSRYSRTDGLRNPGGTTGGSFVGLFLSSTSSS